MLGAGARARDPPPADQTIDVAFDEFMAGDVAMVSRIYSLADQPMSPESRTAMEAFMEAHPRGRHGGVIYDLAEVGLDRDERREALRFYVDRFVVSIEGER